MAYTEYQSGLCKAFFHVPRFQMCYSDSYVLHSLYTLVLCYSTLECRYSNGIVTLTDRIPSASPCFGPLRDIACVSS